MSWVVFLSGGREGGRLLCGLPDVWGPAGDGLIFETLEEAQPAYMPLCRDGWRCWPEPAWHYFSQYDRPPGLNDHEWEAQRRPIPDKHRAGFRTASAASQREAAMPAS